MRVGPKFPASGSYELKNTPPNEHIHKPKCTHTQAHAHTHTHTHMRIHSHKFTHIHTHTLSLSLSLSLTDTHTYTHIGLWFGAQVRFIRPSAKRCSARARDLDYVAHHGCLPTRQPQAGTCMYVVGRMYVCLCVYVCTSRLLAYPINSNLYVFFCLYMDT